MEGFLVTDHSNINPELFDDIPPRYIVPFMRNLALYPSESPFGKVDWKAMAYNFPSIREVSVSVPPDAPRSLTTDGGA
jgi:hypothetical protein